MPGAVLRIDEVNIYIEGESDIETVDIGGREDIFEHDDVRYFVEEENGKITRLEGEFELGGHLFSFQVGYMTDTGLGRVKVFKQGRGIENEQVVKNAYELVYDLYEKYFVDV